MSVNTPYMYQAIALGRQQKSPFAALLFDAEGKLLCQAVNSVATDGPLAHAEMNVLQRAYDAGHMLKGTHLVTTCEPCPMCMAGIIWSRVAKVTFGASIDQIKTYTHQIDIKAAAILSAGFAEVAIEGGIAADTCLSLFEQL